MQNKDKIMHFWEPENISEGDIAWMYDGIELIGPLFIQGIKDVGYGSNKRIVYKLYDTLHGCWYQSEKRWLRVPMEIT